MAKTVAIVVPAHNEAGNLPELHARLQRVWNSEPSLLFELVFIDDGSTDGTLETARRLRTADPRVRYHSLSRNFGHQAAITAGLDRSEADAVIVMDADLQHPPETIPALLDEWRRGAQVVNTSRLPDARLPLFKRLATFLFYWVINKLSDTAIEPNAADFRLLDRRAVMALRQFPERARFVRGLVSWIGFRRALVSYRPDRRFSGQTKYSQGRMWRLALDAIFSFSTVPLRFVSWLGALTCVGAAAEAIFALYGYFVLGTTVPGWTSTLVVVLFIGGTQMLAMGVFGAYLGNVYEEARRRPLYLVNDSSDEPREDP